MNSAQYIEKFGTLFELLKMKRPYGTEQQTYERFLKPLGVEEHPSGNYLLTIPTKDGSIPNWLFSSHLDTVDSRTGQRQLSIDANIGVVLAENDILGADDGAGVWLMMEMIRANKPGIYLFHIGEECGGVGSSEMADHYEDFFKDIDFAIAFDRKGNNEVVNSQYGGTCCSLHFTDSMSDALGMPLVPAIGSFTDTANYTHLVSECTNLSVGYYNQHTSNEMLDLDFLLSLKELLLRADFTTLVKSRVPEKRGSYSYGAFGSYYSDNKALSYKQIEAIIRDYPEEAADALWNLSVSMADFPRLSKEDINTSMRYSSNDGFQYDDLLADDDDEESFMLLGHHWESSRL